MAQLSDFKHKSVQGLYLYSHFEANDGSFIQVHCRGEEYIYQDADGNRSSFTGVKELEKFLSK